MGRWAVLALAGLLISACGGGSSSGGGGSAGDLAGTYNGTATLSATALGETATATENITVRIESNGNVTVTGSEGGTATGTLSGNRYRAVADESQDLAGQVFCEGAQVVFDGTVEGNVTSGSVSGQLCITLSPANVNGSFRATR